MEEFSWINTIDFTCIKRYVPPVRHGYVIRVYDGDTFTLCTPLPNSTDPSVYEFQIRLRDIDTPEIKANDSNEKKMAQKAQLFLRNKILHQFVQLENVGVDKYGRLLSDVYLNKEHINQLLLKEGYAVPYKK